MAGWLEERKEKRFYQEILAEDEISDRAYNFAIGGILVYGLLMNVGMCYAFGDSIVEFVLGSPAMFYIAYFVLCFGGIMLSSKSDNAVLSFVGYNMVAVPIGLVLTVTIYAYGGLGSEVITQAFIITALITGFMVAFAVYKPEFFEKLGGVLFACLGGLVLAEVVLLIFRVDQEITSWIGAALFSLYIGYDFHKAQAYQKTLDNAVDSALDIYLDVINLLLRIIRILGSKGGSRSRR